MEAFNSDDCTIPKDEFKRIGEIVLKDVIELIGSHPDSTFLIDRKQVLLTDMINDDFSLKEEYFSWYQSAIQMRYNWEEKYK